MSSLSDAYDRDDSSRSAAWAVCLLAGSLVAAVGFVATAASLIVGLGVAEAAAFRIAALLGGALPLAVFLVPQATAPGSPRSLALAGVGALTGVAGLGLFWTGLPAGWTGDLAGLPSTALVTYAAGLGAAFAARLAADDDGCELSRPGDGGRSTGTDRTVTARDANALGGVEGATGDADRDWNRDRDSRSGVRVEASDSTGVGDAPATPAVGDGGEDDDDVEFFDDE